MNKYIRFFACFLLIALTSCSRYYLSVCKVPVDKWSLASTYAETPNPKGKNPPQGEKLYISWLLPLAFAPTDATLRLRVLYRNLEKEEHIYELPHRLGTQQLEIVGNKFTETGGIYSYHVELLDRTGKVLTQRKQRMWTELITL